METLILLRSESSIRPESQALEGVPEVRAAVEEAGLPAGCLLVFWIHVPKAEVKNCVGWALKACLAWHNKYSAFSVASVLD